MAKRLILRGFFSAARVAPTAAPARRFRAVELYIHSYISKFIRMIHRIFAGFFAYGAV